LWSEPAAAAVQARLGQLQPVRTQPAAYYELADVARNKARSGVPDEVARAGLDVFAEQKIVLRDIRVDRLFDIAQRLSLTAYDAAYLCLAEELQAPLITLDRRLAEAAQRHLGNRE
jgi:predicted nucleic acid-binding protein